MLSVPFWRAPASRGPGLPHRPLPARAEVCRRITPDSARDMSAGRPPPSGMLSVPFWRAPRKPRTGPLWRGCARCSSAPRAFLDLDVTEAPPNHSAAPTTLEAPASSGGIPGNRTHRAPTRAEPQRRIGVRCRTVRGRPHAVRPAPVARGGGWPPGESEPPSVESLEACAVYRAQG